MKAIHGGKKKNDRLDSRMLAELMRCNLFPMAYAYPQEMRATRDLLRRRHRFVALRAECYTHIQNTFSQQAILDPLSDQVKKKTSRRNARKALCTSYLLSLLCRSEYLLALTSSLLKRCGSSANENLPSSTSIPKKVNPQSVVNTSGVQGHPSRVLTGGQQAPEEQRSPAGMQRSFCHGLPAGGCAQGGDRVRLDRRDAGREQGRPTAANPTRGGRRGGGGSPERPTFPQRSSHGWR